MSECGKCRVRLKRNENFINCSGYCKKDFHLECENISTAEYQVIKNIANLKWFCISCAPYFNAMIKVNSEMYELKNSIKQELSEFKSLLNAKELGEEVNTKNKKSYADVAGEVVIIKPKSSQDCQKTKEVLRKAINPTALEVGIQHIKEVKEGGVVIKCKSKEEVEKIKNAAERNLKKNYEINTPQQKNPKIKIVDIENNMDKQKLENCMIKQNAFIKHDDLYINVKVIKKMKTKFMAIVECDPITFQKIIDRGKLGIDWSMCRVFEYISVFRCFKCGDFDHRAKECDSESACLKCSKTDHLMEACVSETIECLNCIRANKKFRLSLKTDHSLFDNSCPSYLRKVEIIKRKIKTISQ